MASAPRTVVESTQADISEMRNASRRAASQVPSITGLRLSPHGAEAKLVDISNTGLLAVCTTRLKVGSSVAVLFEGGFTPSPVVGRIARFAVASMGRDGVLRYHVGISFNKPILLEPEPEAATASTDATLAESSDPGPAPAAPVLRNRW